MLIDLLIVVTLLAVVYRGHDSGLVRQFCAAVGFVAGLFTGVWLQPHVVNIGDSTLTRAVVSLTVIFGMAIFAYSLAEFGGFILKQRLQHVLALNKVDAILGSIIAGVTFLLGLWLVFPVLRGVPDQGFRQDLQQSHILATLNRYMPGAPDVLSGIGKVITPNGFPDVFAGLERAPVQSDKPLPNLGDLQAAVDKTRDSVVKLEGRGCGGVVEGSGYVAAENTVLTNAHVVAGVNNPTVVDQNGRHDAKVIWFDPDLDVAVVRVSKLAGGILTSSDAKVANGTPAVVAGYPGGGDFTVSAASLLDQFTATGRNIYGRGTTNRDIFELKADIIPGNSGGPLINQDGVVIGLIFAQSTTYDQVGYALQMKAVLKELNQAIAQNHVVGTGQCAD